METRLLVGLKEGRVKTSQTVQVVLEVWRYAGDLTFGGSQGRECQNPTKSAGLAAWWRRRKGMVSPSGFYPTHPTLCWVSSSLGVKHIYLESADLNQTEGQP